MKGVHMTQYLQFAALEYTVAKFWGICICGADSVSVGSVDRIVVGK